MHSRVFFILLSASILEATKSHYPSLICFYRLQRVLRPGEIAFTRPVRPRETNVPKDKVEQACDARSARK